MTSAHWFGSFRTRDYRWLWLITALTNAAMWTFTLVVSWQIFALTHSSAWSGAVLFATLAPNILGAPIAGVLADFANRRDLLLAAATLQILITGLLGGLTAIGLITPVTLLLLSFLFGFGSSTLSVTLNALLPTLIPKDRLFNAFSLQAIAQRGTEFVGPAIASPLLMWYGARVVYPLAAILYLGAAVSVLALRRPTGAVNVRPAHPEATNAGSLSARFPDSQPARPRTARRLFGPFVDGFRYIVASRAIALIVLLVGVHCALTMAYMGVLPKFVKFDLGGASGLYGLLMSTVGLGSIFGTLLLAGVRQARVRGRLYVLSALTSGLFLAAFAVCRSHAAAVLSMVGVGASQAVFMTLSLTYAQEMAEESMRGRVSSVYSVLAGGLMSIANLGYGSLANRVDPTDIFLAIGLLFTVLIGLCTFLSPPFRAVSRTGVFATTPGRVPADEGVAHL